jgi:hypothetical protein
MTLLSRPLFNRPLSIPAPQRAWIPSKAAGGSDVSVALTGQAMASTAGTLTPSSSISLSGQVLAAAQGAVAPANSLTLGGQLLASSAGTLTPSTSKVLTGQSASIAQGTLVAAFTIPLTGALITIGQGTVTAPGGGGDVTIALTGQALAISQGICRTRSFESSHWIVTRLYCGNACSSAERATRRVAAVCAARRVGSRNFEGTHRSSACISAGICPQCRLSIAERFAARIRAGCIDSGRRCVPHSSWREERHDQLARSGRECNRQQWRSSRHGPPHSALRYLCRSNNS